MVRYSKSTCTIFQAWVVFWENIDTFNLILIADRDANVPLHYFSKLLYIVSLLASH